MFISVVHWFGSDYFFSKRITRARETSSELHTFVSAIHCDLWRQCAVRFLVCSVELLYNSMWMYTCEWACQPTPSVFSLQPISNADFIVPVEIEGTTHQVKCCVWVCLLCRGGVCVCVCMLMCLQQLLSWIGMGLVTDQLGFCSDGRREPSTGQMLNREEKVEVDASASKWVVSAQFI